MQEVPESISTADSYQEREQYSKTIPCIRTRKPSYVLRPIFFCLRPYRAIRNVLHDARDTDTATKTVQGAIHLFLYIFFDFVEFLYVVSFIYIACQEFRPLSPAPTVSLHSVLVLLLSTLIVDEDINLVFQPLQYSNGSIFPLMDQNQNLIPTAKICTLTLKLLKGSTTICFHRIS